MKFQLFALVAASTLFFLCGGQQAQQEISLQDEQTAKMLQLIIHNAIKSLAGQVVAITPPDIVQSVKIPLGHVSVRISETALSNIHASGPTAVTPIGNKDAYTIELHLGAHVGGSWRWKKGLMKSHGHFRVDTELTSTLRLWVHRGQPSTTVSIDSVHVSTQHFSFKITGSKLSWLYHLMNDIISGKIRGVVEKEVSKAIRGPLVTAINKLLAAGKEVVEVLAVQ